MKVKGFVQSMATPIIKAFKKTNNKKNKPSIFYTLTEYKQWLNKLGDKNKNWKIKYYKGLGTSSEKEARECFNDFLKKIL